MVLPVSFLDHFSDHPIVLDLPATTGGRPQRYVDEWYHPTGPGQEQGKDDVLRQKPLTDIVSPVTPETLSRPYSTFGTFLNLDNFPSHEATYPPDGETRKARKRKRQQVIHAQTHKDSFWAVLPVPRRFLYVFLLIGRG